MCVYMYIYRERDIRVHSKNGQSGNMIISGSPALAVRTADVAQTLHAYLINYLPI